MSDSDDDSLSNNVFTFQNDNTTMSARGPHINNTNLTGLSFRNNVLTSTMHMPVNFERQRYGGSNFDQRSMYCRRETSPMSLRSVPSYDQHSFNHSTYQNGTSIQRSMYNGISRGPTSVRSIDSTASVSAADIVFAFKNVKFNKYDLRIIKDAYHKLIKTRQRKRVEKRRNLKMFLKGTKRKSGEDSGEQGSDSSISSDDCRSVRTTICKENIPGLKQMRDVTHLSTAMQEGTNHIRDISHFRNNTRENTIFTDQTDNIKQKFLRKIISVNSNMANSNTKQKLNALVPQHLNASTVSIQNTSIMTQKERFTKGFVLPSKRFNRTISEQPQLNSNGKKNTKPGKNIAEQRKHIPENDSDQEEIFHGFPVNHKEIHNNNKKRCLDSEDSCNSNKKRNKVDSSKTKKTPEPTETTCSNNQNGNSNDFIFAKPKMPIKKGSIIKGTIPEKLLAKSNVPPIAEEIDFNFTDKNKKSFEMADINVIHEDNLQSDTLHSNSDVSMRPSFIKRKLFTQKLDVAENKNASSDSLGVNSPKNIYSASMRERIKTRKLTSQSCLSREVLGEDNNVLDLIHKIVPPDQINNTNIGNRTECSNSKANDLDKSNKWDVTAVIANCDNQDISDTYTDEEIFNVNQDKNSEDSKKSVQGPKTLPQCKIVVQKMPPQTLNGFVKNNNNIDPMKSAVQKTSKISVTDTVKSFWDSDIESDMELIGASRIKHIQQNQEAVHLTRNRDIRDKHNQSNKKIINTKGTILTVRSCNQLVKNNNIKSHTSPVSSGKNCQEPHTSNSPPVKVKDNTVDKYYKDTNLRHQTGKANGTLKENVLAKNEGAQRKPKAKQCVDCIEDKPINRSKKANKNTQIIKYDENSNSKKEIAKKSCNTRSFQEKTAVKSKDCKRTEIIKTDKDATNKVIKSGQKKNTNSQRQPVNNARVQPKRKSKEKSILEFSSSKSSNAKTPNKMSKTKGAKALASNNNSIDNVSTIITRSREKLSFNSSQGDYSSMNLSNMSDRSLRLCQRIQRSRN